ncbi:polysaccharide deacetylase family protein [Halobacteriaceae archaeon GCM10025711]
MLDDYAFALLLTHDVDRPYKTYQSVYDAVRERSPGRLLELLSDENPYWQFEEIMDLERDLGVRSAFYFLNEQHLLFDRPIRDWFSPRHWIEHLGRYDVTAPEIVDVIETLDAGGWEVGLHGSYHTPDDRDRLREEKATLESILGHPVLGGRQHYLNLSVPRTWEHHSAIGLRYDASAGSSTEYGFQHGYGFKRPFDDEFVVFPLTMMEVAVMQDGDLSAAEDAVEDVLREAADNDAVMTALWHPRYFDDGEFPGYRSLYRFLVERATEMGAWTGPPGDFYARIDPESVAGPPPHSQPSGGM